MSSTDSRSPTTTGDYKNPHSARFAHIKAALKGKDFRPSESENVVVIGKTGSGKTSIVSLLLDRDVGVGHGFYSQTTKTMEYDFHLPERYGDRPIKLIDTQGVMDTQISMATVLESLVDGLTGRFYHVNAIMLVLECARFTKETQDALACLCQTFGLDDIERSRHLLIVITKLEHLPTDEANKVLQDVIEHPFFVKLNISQDYLRHNTIQAFAGQSKGLNPFLASAYEQLRVVSREKLLDALLQKHEPMTVSNDFPQKLINMLTNAIQTTANTAEMGLAKFHRTFLGSVAQSSDTNTAPPLPSAN
ncbi:GTPase IMAP member 4 [Mortierella hygrophila]|uniref:GTPase IMAP member 4 n=1 Tax=Mortierella hygrophila TaxID=979708 RepID=A0A9P6K2F2_9FUNG|nr:GTPase IMAP member 4 [Mortierella hygrophila]